MGNSQPPSPRAIPQFRYTWQSIADDFLSRIPWLSIAVLFIIFATKLLPTVPPAEPIGQLAKTFRAYVIAVHGKMNTQPIRPFPTAEVHLLA